MPEQRDLPAKPGANVPITDSPWFWLLVFCAAGLLFLAAIWPRYAARQRRLEMQFRAREEILQRQATGDTAARPPGAEGEAPPPAPGELIIPLWPVLVVVAALGILSACLLWRSRRRAGVSNSRFEPGNPP
jgi:hypothetical protein